MLFNFSSDYILENERVLLRPLQISDFDHLLVYSLQEPELWNYSLQNAAGEENLKQYINAALIDKAALKAYPFIVYDKHYKQYAGTTRYYDLQFQNLCLQLGYTWYGKHFQGTGLNKHCKFLLLQFAFEQLKMERVEFRADNDNERSISAMLSIGCTIEGILRSNMPKPTGGRRDSIVLSILKHEWQQTVKDQLAAKL